MGGDFVIKKKKRALKFELLSLEKNVCAYPTSPINNKEMKILGCLQSAMATTTDVVCFVHYAKKNPKWILYLFLSRCTIYYFLLFLSATRNFYEAIVDTFLGWDKNMLLGTNFSFAFVCVACTLWRIFFFFKKKRGVSRKY